MKFLQLAILAMIPGLLLFKPEPGLAEEYINSIGMEFVLVPAGSFSMGESPPLAEGKEDEHPAHEVTISKPFYMGRHEVTQSQWEK